MKYFLYCRKSTEAEDRQVMSLTSQRDELARAFGANPDIEVIQAFEEAKSAKSPGRPLFDEMLRRLEAGEAEGIVAWAPDRLARNSIDGGRLVYLLDRGVLKDLKFATYTFENNPQGKFMLSIMFGQSKYYSDALSENVHRGLRAKLDRGWRPARPPLGYRTDPRTRTIETDPITFPLVRRMFELILQGRTAIDVARIARDEWGLRMPANRQSRREPISVATVYRILKNPFYAGRFVWRGQIYVGRHTPVVSAREFTAVRERLSRKTECKPQVHVFPYTGLIRCGSCGLMVTAEQRTKPSGKRYTYYHCTKRALGPRCKEPPIREDQLEAQCLAFLAALTIPAEIETFVLEALKRTDVSDSEMAAAQRASLRETLSALQQEYDELARLRAKRLIDDDEFARERARVSEERAQIQERLVDKSTIEWFELAAETISFNNQAVFLFLRAAPHEKRRILKIVGSNPTLSGQILSIQAAKPFQATRDSAEILIRCGFGNEVRTRETVQKLAEALQNWILENPDRSRNLLASICDLRKSNMEDDRLAA